MPVFFKKTQYYKYIAPKGSKTAFWFASFNVVKFLFTLLACGLVVNIMTTSLIEPYKLTIMQSNTSATIDSTQTKLTLDYTNDSFLQFTALVRVYHAFYGFTTEWVHVGLFLYQDSEPIEQLASVQVEDFLVRKGVANYQLQYNVSLATKSTWPL